MNTTPRRTAIYLRVSLDATGEGLAVDRQREACLSIVASRGWNLVGEYVDNSISATDAKKNRPGYNSLVRDLEAGRFDALVCYDLDRLTRQPRQLEDWIDAADRGNLALVTANGEADLTTDAGRLFARIKLAVARSEVERKSVRQRDAARQRSEIGRPPLGVRLTGYTPKGEIVPDEAEIVRQIFERFAEGAPLRGIARTLTEAGVSTRHGRPWNPSSIRTILTNPRYAGRAVYQGKETGKRGAWTPLVDDDLFERVQATLKDSSRRTQDGTERKHLGSGIYLCAVCEQPLSAWSGQRYRCRHGGHVNRAQRPVDRFVEAVLVERLGRPDLADLLAGAGVDTAPYLAEIDRQKRLIRRAEADYKAELIEAADLKSTREGARTALRAAEDALANLSRSSSAASVIGSPDPAGAYLASDLTARRAVLDFFVTVRLRPGHRYSRAFDPETVEIEWRKQQ
ncbi:MAG TPA: recombinase family protein [Nocardioides sp.]|nr:recombinase family protein [Nocardioides sp.]